MSVYSVLIYTVPCFLNSVLMQLIFMGRIGYYCSLIFGQCVFSFYKFMFVLYLLQFLLARCQGMYICIYVYNIAFVDSELLSTRLLAVLI